MADSSCESSDEDVILPNSPLYDYLKEVQTESIENLTIYSEVVNKTKLPECESNHFTDSIKSVFGALKNCVLLFCRYMFPSVSQFNENRLSKKIFQITSKKLLIYEDKLFLESLEFGISDKQKNVTLVQFTKLPSLILSGSLLIACLNIYKLEGVIFFDDKFYWILEAVRQSVFILASVFSAVFMYQIFTFVSQYLRCQFVVNEILKISDSLSNISSLLKKSHKLLQESELIARGFTSAAVTGVAERLELSYGLPLISTRRQHPEFRKHIFSLSKDIFLLHRKSTCKLIHELPVKSEFNFSSQCIALFDLSEFGSFFSYDLSSDHELEKILEVTDNFSISFLKMIFKLMELQISEFFKCLSLASIISCKENHVPDISISKVLNILNSILKHISKDIYFAEQKLIYTYHYYRSLEATCNIEEDAVVSKELKTSALEVSVHNMSLHMKTALSRMLEVEDYLNEHIPISKKNYTDKFVQHINKFLLEIKSEIDVCNDCFEECNKELLPLGSNDDSLHIGCMDMNGKNFNDSKINVSMIKNIECNIEPIIKDEVFEAIITQSMIESNMNEREIFEGDEKSNVDKNAAAHLMQELKNILVVRADEYRVREEKALASKLQESITESLVSDLAEEKHFTDNAQASVHPEKFNAENLCYFSKQTKEKEFELNLDMNYGATNSRTLNFSKYSVLQNNLNENKLDDLKTVETDFGDSNAVQLPMKFTLNDNSCGFSASIAALAAQRNQFGLSSEECFKDDSGSEYESEQENNNKNEKINE